MRFQPHAGAVVMGLMMGASLAQVPSGSSGADETDRQRAFALFAQHRMPEAVPLLRAALARAPQDTAAHEALGVALVSVAATETDPARAVADRLEARRELKRARDLGDTSDISRVLLAQVREDGSAAPLSAQPDVDAALRAGEAAFGRGDWPAAIAAYARAWSLDSTSYLAALYLGDSYFATRDMDRAGEWFAKAVALDPNQELAYRYWGDALMGQGKIREARAKYIEGIAADPYRETSLNGLHNWLMATTLNLRKPPLTLPAAPTTDAHGHTRISIDAAQLSGNAGAAAAWLMYSVERSAWQKGTFKKEFPQAKAYRHSLREEMAALNLVLQMYRENLAKDPAQRDDSLERLATLSDAGLLEPFVLFNAADAQLAQDYPAYREAHRDRLIAYLDQYLVPPAP